MWTPNQQERPCPAPFDSAQGERSLGAIDRGNPSITLKPCASLFCFSRDVHSSKGRLPLTFFTEAGTAISQPDFYYGC